ncbi:hypothetical protein PCANC_26685 [Puccinia coronata f. sp. avenae]|uniref:Uncharacterized protein n=1 Tax=Puccinia coronata f. sp. avenae TaxID=200324 RepID=A0A2N5S781_9BASI|nr:hypothetical protein PCANC_26685 [Puccinia coronata f. sp. avenae]
MKLLKSKWNLYNIKANYYNKNFSPGLLVSTPNFNEMKSFALDDIFWNMGSLSHPNEPWANDQHFIEGIEELLKLNHCKDKLWRIAREAHQAVVWGIEKFKSLDNLWRLLVQDPQSNIKNRKGQQNISEICSKHKFPRRVLDA